MSTPSRLQHLRDLRDRIDLEIEREQRYQQRIRRLRGQLAIAVTTRGDWTDRVVTAAAERFDCTAGEVMEGGRHTDAVRARFIAAWLLRDTGRSYSEIGRALGKDHTSVMNGVKRVEADPRLLATACAIRDELTSEEAA